MDAFSTADDFYTLAEEKFDFDVSMSSASSREDGGEDEVFVGPVTDEGKVTVHLAMDSVSSGPSVAEEQLWSPCSGEDFDRVCSEAQKLSTRFEDRQTAERRGHMAHDFVQDAGAKLDMFSKPFTRALSPIKRETFCVQDSPVKLLPPAIQKRLLKGGSSSGSGSSVGSGVRDRVNSSRARLNTSSPASGSATTRTQPKMALRSKAGLGSSGILPSKPLVPAASSATLLKTAKTRAVPAENASRLAPSSKVGLRSKAHPLQARGVVDARRHAPSSSLSSLNSSVSVSPTGKGKLSASLNMSTSGPSSRAPTTMSRLASTSTTAAKTRRCRAAEPPPPPPAAAAATVRGLRRSSSFSVQSRKTSDTTDPTKLARSTPVKRAVPSTPTPFQQSPAKRASVSSVSSQQPLGPPRAKPMAFIAPNPSTRLSALKRSESVVHSPDPLKIKIPMRLRSAGSLDSLLQEKVVLNSHLFQSTPSVSRIRRPSALPNPVNRSVVSCIPAMTPSRLPGSGPTDTFISARKTSNQSSTRVDSAASEEMVVSPKKQLFSLEDADPAALQTQMQNVALTCVKGLSLEAAQEVVENTLPQQEFVENPEENVAPRQEVEENMESQKEDVENPEENQDPESCANLIELQSVEEVISAKTEEILLMDIPVSMFKPEDKPLIDLSNTPDLIRTVSHKDREIQLIDLTSPLMKWSPEKKENVNEAPLINFSF